jgi:hypothetical protein
VKGRQTYVPGVGLVTYIPGGRTYYSHALLAATAKDHALLAAPKPAATDWDAKGIAAVAAVLAACLIADGATLLFAAWLFL